MRVGKNYLIHCGDWHTYVGHCAAQLGPLIFEMEQVSKISDTGGGDNWHELAAGNKEARSRATYLHYDTPCPVPLGIIAFEWVGDLPERNKLAVARP